MVFGVNTTLNLAFFQKLLSKPLEEAALIGKKSFLLPKARGPKVSFSNRGTCSSRERLKDPPRSPNDPWMR